MEISFRSVTIEDCKLIRHWIKSNEFVRKWYYNNKIPKLQTLEKKVNKKLTEKKISIKIVLYNNQPIGYIQSYAVDGNGAWTNKVKVFENMVSIDYFIGNINFIHKGIGSKMITEYIEKEICKNSYKYVLISPDTTNLAKKRLMEKCGFTYIKTVNVPYKNSKTEEAIYIKKI